MVRRIRRGRRGGRGAFSERLFLNHSFNLVANTQANVSIFTATAPCTVRHVLTRMNLQCSGAGPFVYGTVLSKLPEGFTTPNSISQTSGQALYKPEELVLAYSTGASVNGSAPTVLPDAMRGGTRKLQVGDQIFVSCLATGAGVAAGTSELIVSS